ncbi:MAG: helix-turn-helix transcriptional regulator [Treponema sp.]|jgi:DNA-binding Xre family transcriptional regulator|nr:helix-turn-helix transcriptional regulator [Treponema sp.]
MNRQKENEKYTVIANSVREITIFCCDYPLFLVYCYKQLPYACRKRGVRMRVSYKKLWKLLIEREIKRKELSRMAGVGASTLTKMSKNENVNLDILVRICSALNCDLHDVAELVPDGDTANKKKM